MNDDKFRITVIHCMHDPDHVYIGRGNKQKNLPHSPLHNPFPLVDESQREQVVKDFEDYFNKKVHDNDKVIMDELYRILEIIYTQGYVNLGCWCKLKPPKPDRPCHGDVIKTFFDINLNTGI